MIGFKLHKQSIYHLSALFLVVSSCSYKDQTPGLVNTTALGTVRGLQYARVQTHFHSPFSFDACDSKGLDAAGNVNPDCLHHIKNALCTNHVNVTFMTDHVEHMAEYDFSSLVQVESGDTVINNGSAQPMANQLNCTDGSKSILSIGIEGKMLALGMENHVLGSVATRQAVYGGESNAELLTLEAEANALVGIPHTESRELATIRAIEPKFIEIYNVHANLDPKIRKKSLGLRPFEHIAKLLNYLVDPFNDLNPDFFFVDFIEYSPLYMQKWNTLLSENRHIVGVGGLDSHENVFAQIASDGERLDSHRRMTRSISNLVLTSTIDIPSVKSAIQAGQLYFVFEGIGTPAGMDFYGTVNGATVEMGSTATVGVGQSSSIVFTIPHVHASSLFMDPDLQPTVRAELHYIDGSGNESVVMGASGGQMIYSDPPAGHYRAHVYMVPQHLYDFVFSKKRALQEFQWMISNPIRVVR